MRHFLKFKSLNLKYKHKLILIRNLSNSLIKYELIKTNLLKSKEIKKFLEPLITLGKNFSNLNFKFLFKKLNNIDSVLKLFKIICIRYKERNGGYIKIIKNGFRKGDNSFLSIIKFL